MKRLWLDKMEQWRLDPFRKPLVLNCTRQGGGADGIR